MFLAALVSASPVPMQSEIVFIALQAAGYPVVPLVVLASIGNVLGSCVTYAVGRWAGHLHGSRWFPFSAERLARARAWFARWGLWSLLLSWAPGGDLLVALAGVMRVPWPLFLILTALAKTGRYLVLALIGAGLFGTG